MTRCIAEPLSRKKIYEMALMVRAIEGSVNDLYFDIVHFLESTLPKIYPEFSFVVKTKEELGECHGLTFPDQVEIQIREDVYENAVKGSGRDRMTMAHELFHLLQHDSKNISFARTENNFIEPYRNPEWQSDAFGGELLIPRHLIKGMTVDEIAEECVVSKAAARCQLKKMV